jgi:hypothetical protein
MSHGSLEGLAIQILRDAPARDMSRSTIQRTLSANGLKPHRGTQWLHSDDPEFEAKALHIARLDLDAPRLYQQGELVLCVDEKTSIQALERKYPGRPRAAGRPERREFAYVRHGTRCLIASRLVPTGQVVGDVSARRARRDFCRPLRRTAEQVPEAVRFHWVVDNLNTHWDLARCRGIARLCGRPFEPKKLRTGAHRRAFLTDPEHKHALHDTPKPCHRAPRVPHPRVAFGFARPGAAPDHRMAWWPGSRRGPRTRSSRTRVPQELGTPCDSTRRRRRGGRTRTPRAPGRRRACAERRTQAQREW